MKGEFRVFTFSFVRLIRQLLNHTPARQGDCLSITVSSQMYRYIIKKIVQCLCAMGFVTPSRREEGTELFLNTMSSFVTFSSFIQRHPPETVLHSYQ
jgi:hypothetical protein